jgi:hypothetical protein
LLRCDRGTGVHDRKRRTMNIVRTGFPGLRGGGEDISGKES